MTDSKANFVPVDDGPLRASGFVVSDPSDLSVTMGFGGPAGTGNQGESNSENTSEYAVKQHEELSYAHKVGEAEYLKKPLFAALPTLADDIAKDIASDPS